MQSSSPAVRLQPPASGPDVGSKLLELAERISTYRSNLQKMDSILSAARYINETRLSRERDLIPVDRIYEELVHESDKHRLTSAIRRFLTQPDGISLNRYRRR